MRNLFVLLLTLVLSLAGLSQKQIFTELPEGLKLKAGTYEEIRNADILDISLPWNNGIRATLNRAAVTTPDFAITTSSGKTLADEAIHYRGHIHGEPGSVIAVSFLHDEVIGMFSIREGNFDIVKEQDVHKIRKSPSEIAVCHTDTDGEMPMEPADRNAGCVRVYWESHYNIYVNKGANTVSYLTSLFNQSAMLFANDGVQVFLSMLYVWDTPSTPYTASGGSGLLGQFQAYRNSYDGDIAVLLTLNNTGGMAASVNGVCGGPVSDHMAVCGIASSFQNVPSYSWSVNVVTHEAGHLMGSRHTHDCVWNGNNTAIDGCGPSVGWPSIVNSCDIGPIPYGIGGTIMSYCYLMGGVGTNFTLGFGPQPASAIQAGTSCAGDCGPSQVAYTSDCVDIEPNNTSNTATSIATGPYGDVMGGIIPAPSDVDFYKFNISGQQRNIKIDLFGLPANYDMQLIRGNQVVAASSNTGNTDEVIIYNNAPTGQYRVKVYSGGESSANCYFILVRTRTNAYSAPAPQDLVVFPNPSKNEFTISAPGATGLKFYLYDSTGRVLNEGIIQSEIFTIPSQPNGTYFLRVSERTVRLVSIGL